MNYCFINGHVFPARGASIGINDLGLLRGYAAFELIRIYSGKLFRVRDHLQRLRDTANSLHLKIEYSDEQIVQVIYKLIKESQRNNAVVRFIVTGGYSNDSMTLPDSPNFLMVLEDPPVYPEEVYTDGVKLITFEFQREMPQSKTTDYLMAIKLQPLKTENNAFDIPYIKDGNILEVTRNNFFVIKGNSLITPSKNILKGITRKAVLELAEPHFNIEERDLSVKELKDADEAFLTGTTKKVIPVVQVDNERIGNGAPGESTKSIMTLFENYVKDYEDEM